ncbi:hypothetical protein DFH09DRAFT_1295460 [Mycena vulgaris]|nr:hypothetical protein DFH09DRAFT_1295460 [Mycena vulgaris]
MECHQFFRPFSLCFPTHEQAGAPQPYTLALVLRLRRSHRAGMDATEWRTPWNCLEIRPGGGNVLRFYELGSVPLKDPQQRYTVLSTAAADAQKGYLGDQWR